MCAISKPTGTKPDLGSIGEGIRALVKYHGCTVLPLVSGDSVGSPCHNIL